MVSEITKGLPTFDRRPARNGIRFTRQSIAIRRFTPPLLAPPWLCFESPGERRRLQRVPLLWDELPDLDLQRLLGESHLLPVA